MLLTIPSVITRRGVDVKYAAHANIVLSVLRFIIYFTTLTQIKDSRYFQKGA
ncbi:hypothetical protein MBAV_004288 [Candidatus Magnetobacterium bavaricum]|uniref:Uncharacterized protein n=1 Tax=Candidatus Magnetobacterium bavaricum TaxID=29290 RepID=A0A0F3GNI5_9BACT|nr:hypothetical protein MBAV_004288 [Candidatus Magnetobacterium bavaricum]